MPIFTKSRTPRWQRRPEHRPEEIAAAALRVFTKCGLHQTTLDDVAKEAGVSKGTIYLYFKSKEELFIAAAQRVVPTPEELPLGKTPRTMTEKELVNLLREVAHTMYRRFCTPAYRAFFSLMAAETLRHPEWGQLYFEKIVLAQNHRFAELLQQAATRGAIRRVDLLLAARAFLGMFLTMALTQEHLGGKHLTPFSEQHIVDSLIDIFLYGIRPRKEMEV
ncbi:MAG: TetR/AcrR family transcriptional regulator [Candidatus Binatia bacterium]